MRQHVKALRANPTDAERMLWSKLRRKQIRALRFRRQFPIGPYIVDFVCLQVKLIIEVDGGQHGAENDAIRSAWLNERGYRVLRFWNNDVLGNIDGVVQTIASEVIAPSDAPLPRRAALRLSPPSLGRGEDKVHFPSPTTEGLRRGVKKEQAERPAPSRWSEAERSPLPNDGLEPRSGSRVGRGGFTRVRETHPSPGEPLCGSPLPQGEG